MPTGNDILISSVIMLFDFVDSVYEQSVLQSNPASGIGNRLWRSRGYYWLSSKRAARGRRGVRCSTPGRTRHMWTKEYLEAGKVQYIDKDIYKVDVENVNWAVKFDIIILKDVIEHIHDQAKTDTPK